METVWHKTSLEKGWSSCLFPAKRDSVCFKTALDTVTSGSQTPQLRHLTGLGFCLYLARILAQSWNPALIRGTVQGQGKGRKQHCEKREGLHGAGSRTPQCHPRCPLFIVNMLMGMVWGVQSLALGHGWKLRIPHSVSAYKEIWHDQLLGERVIPVAPTLSSSHARQCWKCLCKRRCKVAAVLWGEERASREKTQLKESKIF